jgi:hypothetical protein
MISHRQVQIVKTASLESAMSQVDGMSDTQREEFIRGFVESHGLLATIKTVKETLQNLSRAQRSAAVGDSGWAANRQQGTEDQRPSQLKHRLNVAGDWSYLLALLLLIGTAGTSDLGGSWGEIFKGFAATSGAAFLGWVFKKLSSLVKK